MCFTYYIYARLRILIVFCILIPQDYWSIGCEKSKNVFQKMMITRKKEKKRKKKKTISSEHRTSGEITQMSSELHSWQKAGFWFYWIEGEERSYNRNKSSRGKANAETKALVNRDFSSSISLSLVCSDGTHAALLTASPHYSSLRARAFFYFDWAFPLSLLRVFRDYFSLFLSVLRFLREEKRYCQSGFMYF